MNQALNKSVYVYECAAGSNTASCRVISFLEHLEAGGMKPDDPCLCCGMQPLSAAWTDLHGQGYCIRCGCTYVMNGVAPSDEFMQKHGLAKKDIPEQYCDCLDVLPVIQEHWQERRAMAVVGCWLGRPPFSDGVYNGFRDWLWNNAERLREAYPTSFDWERTIARRDEVRASAFAKGGVA